MAIDKICINCGKRYTVSPSRSNSKYCSQKCSVEHMRGEKSASWRGGLTLNPNYQKDWRRKNVWKGHYTDYTENEENKLREMFDAKMTVKDMAKILGRSKSGVQAKLQRMGLSHKKRWTENDLLLLKKEHKEGVSVKEMADKLGTTKKAIEWQISKLGIGAQPGSREFSKKASRRNKRAWADPEHAFNQPEYRKKLKDNWADPNSPFNTEEYRQALSDRAKQNKVWFTSGLKGKGRYKGGHRPDLGFYVRSQWEANVARYIKFLMQKGEVKGFEYEADTFEFTNIKRGTRSYTPDFKIYNNDGSLEYWEVKGFMDQVSKTKLKRMAKYYPDIPIRVIEREQYNEIKNWSRLIEHWDDEGLEDVAKAKVEVGEYLEGNGWFVVLDTPYQLSDETCVRVLHVIAVKEGRHLFIDITKDRFLARRTKTRFQNDLEAAGGEYILCRGVDDLLKRGI